MTRSRIPVGRIVAAVILTFLILRIVGGGASLLAGLFLLPLLILKFAVIAMLFGWLVRRIVGGPGYRRHHGPRFGSAGSFGPTGCRQDPRRSADRWQSHDRRPSPMSPEEAEWEGFIAEARREVDDADHPQ